MGWAWQEIYNSVPFVKNPDDLASRLIAAEKAILQRLQELPEDAGANAEVRALREALDDLYCVLRGVPPLQRGIHDALIGSKRQAGFDNVWHSRLSRRGVLGTSLAVMRCARGAARLSLTGRKTG